MKKLSKSFGSLQILKSFSYSFEKGSRIGIVGPNGSGKTTFIRLLTGRLEPDDGGIDIGANTRFGYFDQLSEAMNPEQTVSGYLSEYAEEIKRGGGETVSVSQLLEDFKFPNERQYARISTLSGGERRRLYLLKILLPAPNFLVFDEPTNDLDIGTLSLLEDFLSNYDGCLISVSHDRYFLDRTADFLFVFDGTGEITVHAGSYSEYASLRKERERRHKQAEKSEKEDTRVRTEPGKQRLSFREQKEFEALLPEVEALEQEKSALEAFFTAADSEPSAMERNHRRYEKVCAGIAEKTARWEQLAERAD